MNPCSRRESSRSFCIFCVLVWLYWPDGARLRATSNEFFEAGSELHHRGLIAIDRTTHRKQLEYNLTKIVEMARSQGIPIVFQTYFHFHGYRVNEVIRDIALRHAVPLADHNLWFHAEVPPARRQGLRIEDGHPSREGYAMIARKLEAALDQTGLLPSD